MIRLTNALWSSDGDSYLAGSGAIAIDDESFDSNSVQSFDIEVCITASHFTRVSFANFHHLISSCTNLLAIDCLKLLVATALSIPTP